jgi:hypothetical protein
MVTVFCHSLLLSFPFSFLAELGCELRVLYLAKQILYHLSYISSPFFCDYFADGSLVNYLPRLAPNSDPPDLSFPSS